MKVTIFGYTPLRNVTKLYTLPMVLSVFLNACSETPNDSGPNSLAKTPGEILNNAEILDFGVAPLSWTVYRLCENYVFNQSLWINLHSQC